MSVLIFVLNNLILVLSKIYLSFQTEYNFTKAPFNYLILLWTFSKASQSIIPMLPGYGKIESVSPQYHLL